MGSRVSQQSLNNLSLENICSALRKTLKGKLNKNLYIDNIRAKKNGLA
jgi:hypothetical protein